MYVLDANVLFSGLLSTNPLYLELARDFYCVTPDYALVEISKYRSLILRKTKVSKPKLKQFTFDFFRLVSILPDFILSDEVLAKASTICAAIDPKDVMYVALALELDATLLTRDKKLVDGLQAAGTVKARFFPQFIAALGAPPAV